MHLRLNINFFFGCFVKSNGSNASMPVLLDAVVFGSINYKTRNYGSRSNSFF